MGRIDRRPVVASGGGSGAATGRLIGARCIATGPQDIPTGTLTTLQQGTVPYDTDNFAAGTGGAGLMVPAGLGGIYAVAGWVAWTANTTGRRLLRTVGGPYQIREDRAASTTGSTFLSVYQETLLYEGDHITLEVWQDSGETLPTRHDAVVPYMACSLSLRRLGVL